MEIVFGILAMAVVFAAGAGLLMVLRELNIDVRLDAEAPKEQWR